MREGELEEDGLKYKLPVIRQIITRDVMYNMTIDSVSWIAEAGTVMRGSIKIRGCQKMHLHFKTPCRSSLKKVSSSKKNTFGEYCDKESSKTA